MAEEMSGKRELSVRPTREAARQPIRRKVWRVQGSMRWPLARSGWASRFLRADNSKLLVIKYQGPHYLNHREMPYICVIAHISTRGVFSLRYFGSFSAPSTAVRRRAADRPCFVTSKGRVIPYEFHAASVACSVACRTTQQSASATIVGFECLRTRLASRPPLRPESATL
jgi:hypothetical protein